MCRHIGSRSKVSGPDAVEYSDSIRPKRRTMSTVIETQAPVESYQEPDGSTPRGTVIVIGGRGESAALYARLGRRLSADAYRVLVVADAAANADALGLRAAAVAADPGLVRPVVVAGSDSGATAALAIASTDPGVAAAVVAGIALPSSALDAPLEDRSACPVHLGLLGTAANFSPEAPAVSPAPADLPAVGVPVLAFHGEADVITPFDTAADHYRDLAQLELWQTVGGKHDAFNDANHRSVAAAIVQFLERLRLGDVIRPVLRPVAL
jgi:pimeloyl-ACP methyl ester carboxylesterase